MRGIWVVSGCPWVAAWSVENKFVQCGPAAPRREGCHRSDPSTPRSGAALCHQAGEAHLPPEHLPAPRLRPLLCVHTPEPLSRLSPRLLWALGWWVLCFTPVSRSVSAAVSAGLWGPWLIPQHPLHRARAGLLARCRCRTHTSLGAESVVSWLADPARTRRHTAHGRGP